MKEFCPSSSGCIARIIYGTFDCIVLVLKWLFVPTSTVLKTTYMLHNPETLRCIELAAVFTAFILTF